MIDKWIPAEPLPTSEYRGTYDDCNTILSKLLSLQSLAPSLRNSLSSVIMSDYIRVALAWRYNSFGHHTESNALCMYDITSTMAHSCAPSTVWHFGEMESFCLRARTALRAGDEITISYLGDEDLLKSIPERHKKTNGWLFTCTCARCEGPIDYCRSFRCPTCYIGCLLMGAVTLMSCTTCNSQIDQSTLRKYMQLEESYIQRLSITDQSDLSDLNSVLSDALNLFHNNHWIIYTLNTWICDSIKKDTTESCALLSHLLSRLSYLQTVFPIANYTSAWVYEELGDYYAHQSIESNQAAETAYSESYWRMKILCGTDHPFCESISAKWTKVQSRRHIMNDDTSSNSD